MDKNSPAGPEEIDQLKARIEFLEKGSRWNFFAIELLRSLGDLHKNANWDRSPKDLFKATQKYLKQLTHCESLGFLMVNEMDSTFELVCCEPSAHKSQLNREMDWYIENGVFAWALKENRPYIVDEGPLKANLMFHVLATNSQVLGMFVGKFGKNYPPPPPDQLSLISIVLHNIAYAMENGKLYQMLSQQNHDLEKMVLDRTGELEKQTHELQQEVQDRKKAERELMRISRQKESILGSAGEGILGVDNDGRFTLINFLGATMIGYSVKELIGKPIDLILHPPDSNESQNPDRSSPIYRALDESISSHVYDEKFWRKDGTCFSVEFTCNPLNHSDSQEGAVVTFRDITQRLEMEEKITHMAYYDSLTHLPNRNLVADRLSMALAHADRSKHMVGVLLLDMDNFKTINDSLGHNAGDLLLKDVAKRLSCCLRKEDTVGRIGGDEFVVLVTGIQNENDITALAKKIIQNLKPSFPIQTHEIFTSFSIGISVFPRDGLDPQTLFKNADAAMYQAKEKGKNTYQTYSPSMVFRATKQMALESGLRKALDRGELFINYQPKFDLKTQQIMGMEALLRWMHPTNGLISPDDFIPIAEESRLIVPIGEWVLRSACEQMRIWESMGFPPLNMAINLSGYQFNQANLIHIVSDTIECTGIDPHFLELEITETVLMDNLDSAISRLHLLNDMGLHLSIDDFGTGYSSLTYLKTLPISSLKIDRSFIQDLSSEANTAIIKAILSLAKTLKLRTVAEGLETEEQMEFLASVDCDWGQGYYFSHPLGVEEMTQLIASQPNAIKKEIP